MNPYFRGWHLPSAYSESASNCDRNYPAMYPASWPSGYFTPPSVYGFQAEPGAKQANSNDWKLQPICSSSEGGQQRDSNGLMKPGYESLLYKPNNGRGEVVHENGRTDDAQRSCCAMSCSCNGQQRLNVIDNTWRNTDMTGSLDFNKNTAMSPYQSLCQRGECQRLVH